MGNIEWIPIAGMPDALKDGREVLLWQCGAILGQWRADGADFGRGGPGWSDSDSGGPITSVAYFAEINPPASPASLSDADLIKAYQESGGEAGDPRADELAQEIERRGLDL